MAVCDHSRISPWWISSRSQCLQQLQSVCGWVLLVHQSTSALINGQQPLLVGSEIDRSNFACTVSDGVLVLEFTGAIEGVDIDVLVAWSCNQHRTIGWEFEGSDLMLGWGKHGGQRVGEGLRAEAEEEEAADLEVVHKNFIMILY